MYIIVLKSVFGLSLLAIHSSHLVDIPQIIRPTFLPVCDARGIDGERAPDALGVLAQHVQGGLGGEDAVVVAGNQGEAVLLGVGLGFNLPISVRSNS